MLGPLLLPEKCAAFAAPSHYPRAQDAFCFGKAAVNFRKSPHTGLKVSSVRVGPRGSVLAFSLLPSVPPALPVAVPSLSAPRLCTYMYVFIHSFLFQPLVPMGRVRVLANGK